MSSDGGELCLQWRDSQCKLSAALCSLLQREVLVDVTLACEGLGRTLRAHQAVLSACSPYFENVFAANSTPHPIVILNGISYEDMNALLQFMYYGQTRVVQSSLPGFLKAAEILQVRGLSGEVGAREGETEREVEEEDVESRAEEDVEMSSGAARGCDTSSTVYTSDLDASEITSDSIPPTVKQEDSTSASPVSQSPTFQQLATNLPVLQEPPLQSTQHVVQPASQVVYPCRVPQRYQERQRVMWTPVQVAQLEQWYSENRYPTGAQTKEYARLLLNLTSAGNDHTTDLIPPSRQNVDYWFQNRRRKDNHPQVMRQREKNKAARMQWMMMRQDNVEGNSTSRLGGGERGRGLVTGR